ncbi:uncharacterized protein LOC132060455 [Lycium ferocissimum]|uniref:uncharacterized protein LOC132060455 n=1 Tax=Lycium ferocissimum TaxID=112874 RepID=UPI002815889A|nr:uncharacterized protein LOC132060455 [Lycium ferocissimum]
MANGFFPNKEVLYKQTPDLGLLRCVDAGEATKLLEKKCHQCQIHSDLIKVAPIELNAMSLPWPLVAWVEATLHKLVTKKVVADFVQNNIICRFGIPESIITDNRGNLNNHLIKDICEQFKISHQNSTSYRSEMNGAVEAANKNIKRILNKMTDNYKGWQEQLPYALLGYRTIARTSTGETPYLLVYGTEAVIPAEVEIPFLRIIQEAELDNAEWVRARYEQLALIDEKRMVVVFHGQLYRQRMARAFNK